MISSYATMGKFGWSVNGLHRSVLADLGGFDLVLHRGQDIDALLRVVLAGHRLVYEPSSVVRHYHHRGVGEEAPGGTVDHVERLRAKAALYFQAEVPRMLAEEIVGEKRAIQALGPSHKDRPAAPPGL